MRASRQETVVKELPIELRIPHRVERSALSHLTIDIINFILYQRQQIPEPVQLLEREYSAGSIEGHRTSKQSSVKTRQQTHFCNQIQKFLDNLDKLKNALYDAFDNNDLIEVNLLIGATPFSAKEIFCIDLSEFTTDEHYTAVSSRIVSLCSRKLCTALISKDEYFMNSAAVSNVHIFIKARKGVSMSGWQPWTQYKPQKNKIQLIIKPIPQDEVSIEDKENYDIGDHSYNTPKHSAKKNTPKTLSARKRLPLRDIPNAENVESPLGRRLSLNKSSSSFVTFGESSLQTPSKGNNSLPLRDLENDLDSIFSNVSVMVGESPHITPSKGDKSLPTNDLENDLDSIISNDPVMVGESPLQTPLEENTDSPTRDLEGDLDAIISPLQTPLKGNNSLPLRDLGNDLESIISNDPVMVGESPLRTPIKENAFLPLRNLDSIISPLLTPVKGNSSLPSCDLENDLDSITHNNDAVSSNSCSKSPCDASNINVKSLNESSVKKNSGINCIDKGGDCSKDTYSKICDAKNINGKDADVQTFDESTCIKENGNCQDFDVSNLSDARNMNNKDEDIQSSEGKSIGCIHESGNFEVDDFSKLRDPRNMNDKDEETRSSDENAGTPINKNDNDQIAPNPQNNECTVNCMTSIKTDIENDCPPTLKEIAIQALQDSKKLDENLRKSERQRFMNLYCHSFDEINSSFDNLDCVDMELEPCNDSVILLDCHESKILDENEPPGLAEYTPHNLADRECNDLTEQGSEDLGENELLETGMNGLVGIKSLELAEREPTDLTKQESEDLDEKEKHEFAEYESNSSDLKELTKNALAEMTPHRFVKRKPNDLTEQDLTKNKLHELAEHESHLSDLKVLEENELHDVTEHENADLEKSNLHELTVKKSHELTENKLTGHVKLDTKNPHELYKAGLKELAGNEANKLTELAPHILAAPEPQENDTQGKENDCSDSPSLSPELSNDNLLSSTPLSEPSDLSEKLENIDIHNTPVHNETKARENAVKSSENDFIWFKSTIVIKGFKF